MRITLTQEVVYFMDTGSKRYKLRRRNTWLTSTAIISIAPCAVCNPGFVNCWLKGFTTHSLKALYAPFFPGNKPDIPDDANQ